MSRKTVKDEKAAGAAGGNAPGLKDEELDRIVLAYLTKKGYANAQQALKNDSRSAATAADVGLNSIVEAETNVANQIMFFNAGENKPSHYDESYTELRKWVAESLELYKVELSQVLWPLFVHSYLDLVARGYPEEARQFMAKQRPHLEAYNEEINRLSAVTLPLHMKENELALLYRQNKKNLEMCSASFELFINMLQDRKFILLLALVNQYLNIRVFSGKPQEEEDALNARTAITGERVEEVSTMNQKKIFWGALDEHPDVKLEAEEDESQKQKKKKAKLVEGQDAARGGKALGNAPSRDRIPLPAMSEEEVEARLKVLKELRQAVKLGPSMLPSVCMYTFLNTYNSLNCISVSEDARLLSTGSDDSHVRIWSVTGKKLKSMKAGDALLDLENSENILPDQLLDDSSASDSKTLIGHSGPVYNTSFSPDNRFLLSCSEDTTVRLWSLQTYTNLVCYKGHNYPVWDVDFSSAGFYFATASHDKTARLWSTDYIYPLRVFAGHMSDVDVVKFHPNCNYVATGSSDKTCRMWDVLKGDCVRLFTGHTGSVCSLAMSPDGRYMASGGEDKTVIVWDLASGKKLGALHGHEGTVRSLSFSVDGSVLASGSADCTVRLWDVKAIGGTTRPANLQLAALPSKATPINTVRFTRQNLLLASGCFSQQASGQATA